MKIENFLKQFSFNWDKTIIEIKKLNWIDVKYFINEYWTAKQRQSNSIHEISYRACFKAELPNFFINLLTKEKDVIYDPFSWRWTSLIEWALLSRNIIVNDINPLSKILIKPRLNPPTINEIKNRLEEIDLNKKYKNSEDLSMFYHKDTLKEIIAIRKYFIGRRKEWLEDNIDRWIEMVATNRLTGHSSWFFSVYTLPPNQALTKERQILINEKRDQKPEYRDIKKIILKKSWTLLKNISDNERWKLRKIWENAIFLNKQAYNTKDIGDKSINLIVTSPPFLDVIKYTEDNWLRCWFNNIDATKIKTTELKKIEDWNIFMSKVFKEFYRIIKNEWYIAFEVWEVKWWKINLDEHVVQIWLNAWFKCIWVLVNQQDFTKTANIWWVNNNNKWTNTNRIVLFQK